MLIDPLVTTAESVARPEMSLVGMVVVGCAWPIKGRIDLQTERTFICIFFIGMVVSIGVLVGMACLVAASPLIVVTLVT